MAKKTTLNEVGEMLVHIVKHMATKEDIKDMATKKDIKNMATKDDIKKLDDRLMGVESKVSGINRRLDAEAMLRDDEKIPSRLADVEKKVFGASRASS